MNPSVPSSFKPIFNRRITSAEIVEDEDSGDRLALIQCDGEKFSIPVLPESKLGFRGDLIGTRLVMGFSKV